MLYQPMHEKYKTGYKWQTKRTAVVVSVRYDGAQIQRALIWQLPDLSKTLRWIFNGLFPLVHNVSIKGSSACACTKVMAGTNNKTRRSAVEDLLRRNNYYII